jgi:hypothetical protein
MNTKKFNPLTLQLSLILSILFNALITIAKVKNNAFNSFLKTFFYNAWFGQTILLIGLYFLIITILSKLSSLASIKFTSVLPIILCATILSFFILFSISH